MCWHKANFWTRKFQQEQVRGFQKNCEATPQKKIENNIQKSKKNECWYNSIEKNMYLLQSQLHDKEPCLLYFKLIILPISILLTWDSFYMIPEGFNPINPNQPRLLRVSCILLSVYSTQSPWNLQLQEWR